MKIPVKTILGLLLPMAVLLVSNQGLAQEQSQTDQILGSEKGYLGSRKAIRRDRSESEETC